MVFCWRWLLFVTTAPYFFGWGQLFIPGHRLPGLLYLVWIRDDPQRAWFISQFLNTSIVPDTNIR